MLLLLNCCEVVVVGGGGFVVVFLCVFIFRSFALVNKLLLKFCFWIWTRYQQFCELFLYAFQEKTCSFLLFFFLSVFMKKDILT